MKENKKAPAAAATTTEAQENVLQGNNTAPALNLSIGAGQGQAGIVDLLQHGEAAAIPALDLAAILHTNTRGLRLKIDAARESGAVILASERGYFLPSRDHAEALAEARRFCSRQDSRLRSNRRASDSARRMLEALEIEASGQIKMEDADHAGA